MADDSRWRPGKPLRIIPIGDVATASEWIPFARRKMVELSRSGDYARRTWMPAPGVVIRGETLRGIPRVFIEVEGYEYITISGYTNELHAGDFGLKNTSKKILDFPSRAPDGLTFIGPNLLHIGGNQFATGPARNLPAEQVAIVSVSGKSASVKYLPRWRSAEEDRYSIVTLQYGGKTVEGVKRIEYLSAYRYAMNQTTYPYEVSLSPSNTFWTQRFISSIDMYAYSSTTPLGGAVSVDRGTLVEDALANPPPVDPIFWIVNPASGNTTRYIPVGDSPPLYTSVDDVVVGVPGTPAPNSAYYTQWNWRRELELDITATVEVDTDPLDPSINLYTTVFVLRFIENIQVLSWDGLEGRDESDNPVYVPGDESATIVSGAAGAAQLPGGVSFDWVIPPNPATGSPGGTYTPWAVASTAGVYRSQRRHMVETSAKIISAATENLGGGRIAILLLTERNDPGFVHGGPWGSWSNDDDVGPFASGKSYLFNMVTITSSNYGQSWHATITRRTVGVSPFSERLQFLNTLLYIGGSTLLAFGRTYTGATVWRSTDAGTSYSMLVPPGGIPTSPDAGMAICLAPGVAGFFNDGKFYRSTDSGATWTTYAVPTDIMTPPWTEFRGRIAIRAIGETYATTKLAIVMRTSNTPNTSKIFLSDDGGATWRVDSTIGKKPYPQVQAMGFNIGVLNTGLPPNPGLPGMYDEPPP